MFDHTNYQQHHLWMRRALTLATQAGEGGEVPVGAVIVDSRGKWVAEAANGKEYTQDATAHAEILAIRAACEQRHDWHLNDCILYVTLEPCAMCAGAIIHARLGGLVYGADDPKTGAIRTVINLPDSACSNHSLAVMAGILEGPCREHLQQWFRQKRARWE